MNVSTAAQLVTAVNSGAAGDTVNLAAGTYLLSASLKPKASMIINGAGIGNSIRRPDSTWNPGTAGLPGSPVDSSTIVRTAYLFDFGGADGVSISGLTMDGMAQLHGATYGYDWIERHVAQSRQLMLAHFGAAGENPDKPNRRTR